jgi:hypothetical protein
MDTFQLHERRVARVPCTATRGFAVEDFDAPG